MRRIVAAELRSAQSRFIRGGWRSSLPQRLSRRQSGAIRVQFWWIAQSAALRLGFLHSRSRTPRGPRFVARVSTLAQAIPEKGAGGDTRATNVQTPGAERSSAALYWVSRFDLFLRLLRATLSIADARRGRAACPRRSRPRWACHRRHTDSCSPARSPWSSRHSSVREWF